MIIKNGFIFDENKNFVEKELFIEDHRIVSSVTDLSDQQIIDAKGMYVIPGLIDIHSHGACGHDFCDADKNGLEAILSYEYAHGITSYCPTSMTVSKEQLYQIFSSVNDIAIRSDMANIVGIHMEGPFIDPSKKGAQKESCILEPDISFFQACNKLSGNRIKLITIAPNTKGAIPFIKALHNEVNISLGHSSADYQTAKEAFLAGANHVTHLYNAMPPLLHREPGIIGAAVENENCMAEIICDGIHIHESIIKASFKLFPDRMILISDSMRATGLQDGIYDLGGQEVHVSGKLATLADGTIAGSATNLFDCMKKAIAFGIPKEEAIAAATMNPAKSIGIYDEVGSLSIGKKADLLLLDKEFNLIKVIS